MDSTKQTDEKRRGCFGEHLNQSRSIKQKSTVHNYKQNTEIFVVNGLDKFEVVENSLSETRKRHQYGTTALNNSLFGIEE